MITNKLARYIFKKHLQLIIMKEICFFYKLIYKHIYEN